MTCQKLKRFANTSIIDFQGPYYEYLVPYTGEGVLIFVFSITSQWGNLKPVYIQGGP